MKLLRPANMHEAIAIAIQVDNKFNDLKASYPKPPAPSKPQSNLMVPHSYPVTRTGNFPVNKLTPEEIQRKRDRDDCWLCDEK